MLLQQPAELATFLARGARGLADVAAPLPHQPGQELPLELGDRLTLEVLVRAVERLRRGRFRALVGGWQPEVPEPDGPAVAEEDAADDDAFELAHVARPVAGHQRVERVRGEARDGLARRRVLLEEVLGEQRDVVPPLASGGRRRVTTESR